MRSLGWALIQYDRCPYKKGKLGERYVQREDYAKKRRKTPCEDEGRDQSG